MKIESTARNAETLFDLLVDEGPLTAGECCKKLDWSRSRFAQALKFARDELCPILNATIPTPLPGDGHTYQVTTDWSIVERGAAQSLLHIEARLKSVARDVGIMLPQLPPRSVAWRRANFLNKHLDPMLRTLVEINDGPR